MFEALLAMLRRWFGPRSALPDGQGERAEAAPSAFELMQQMKADRAVPADGQGWASGMNNFKSKVFSAPDRARIWRRARRRYPGEVIELDLIEDPTSHDLEALTDVLRDLERG